MYMILQVIIITQACVYNGALQNIFKFLKLYKYSIKLKRKTLSHVSQTKC